VVGESCGWPIIRSCKEARSSSSAIIVGEVPPLGSVAVAQVSSTSKHSWIPIALDRDAGRLRLFRASFILRISIWVVRSR
jgi:hypothetical protein